MQGPKDQFFTSPITGDAFYVGDNNMPVNPDGTPIEGEHITKFVLSIDEYILLSPEAKKHEGWLKRDQDRPGTVVLLMQAEPCWSCMPGGMYIVKKWNAFKHPKNDQYSMRATVLVNDGDDAYARKEFDTNEEADQALEDLKLLAPFHMGDLVHFGYNRE